MKFKIRMLLMAMAILPLVSLAQPQQSAEMADAMRANGKIYVVVAVLLTILAGLLFYVYRLDRKISSLEKNTK
jgi:Na+/proline symporter